MTAKVRFGRRALVKLVAAGALFGGAQWGHRRAARSAPPDAPLSDEAKALAARAWEGLTPQQVLDCHVHVVGLGTGGTGCEVNPKLQSWASPAEALKFSVYLGAAGITEPERADAQYMELLQRYADTAPHGRFLLFPFDKAHDEQGAPLDAESEFFTPNDYVARLAKAAPSLFVAAASVHPYRKDAVDALERAAADGAVAVKWLPNAMNIDPGSPKCDAFYAALERLGLPLITHAGEEKAVHAEERQRLGNPLLLRRPLEKGVRVVVAHCASLGQNPDLDKGEGAAWLDNFDLFVRLMEEKQWEGRLFGEVSAVTLWNRLGKPLEVLLGSPQLQARCVNGSDYPLPAVNVLMQTRPLVSAGYLSAVERELLNEIDRHNPLLYDFVMKRTLKREVGGVVQRFAADVFSARPEVFPRLAGG